MEVLDLLGNNFEILKHFADFLRETIFGVRSIKTLVVSDNGFDPMIVPLLKGTPSIREVVL